MAAHYNRGATFPEAPVLPDDPLIDALARTNAKVEDFAISPDGSRIAYVSAESGGYDLWIVNIDGSNNRCIVHMYPEQCLLPSWSPDGEWLSYGARATTRPPATSTSSERTARSRRTTSPTTTAPAATTSGLDGRRTARRWSSPAPAPPGSARSRPFPRPSPPARSGLASSPTTSGTTRTSRCLRTASGWPSSRTAAAMRTTSAWTSSSPPSRAAPVAT